MEEKFTIEVTDASQAQLQTIVSEFTIMMSKWKTFGPQFIINGKEVDLFIHQMSINLDSRTKKHSLKLQGVCCGKYS